MASKPKQVSPKIIKTGFPASSVTKAQLEEQAGEEARRNSSGSYTSDSVGKKSSLHEQILGTKLSDSESDSSASKRSNLSTPSKKHVTFNERNYGHTQNHVGKPKDHKEVASAGDNAVSTQLLKVCFTIIFSYYLIEVNNNSWRPLPWKTLKKP